MVSEMNCIKVTEFTLSSLEDYVLNTEAKLPTPDRCFSKSTKQSELKIDNKINTQKNPILSYVNEDAKRQRNSTIREILCILTRPYKVIFPPMDGPFSAWLVIESHNISPRERQSNSGMLCKSKS